MKAFFKEKKRSAGYARDRMKLLLISERIDCSPQMMKMLRNDMIHTVKKYLTIDEEQVKIQITQEPAACYNHQLPCRQIGIHLYLSLFLSYL